MDYANPAAELLVDAHALPFADESFDCVFSYAVLEHLHTPQVAIQEIARVLKVGGVFVGTVSQGEPFHSSFFHFTPWGLLSLLRFAPQLEAVRLWPGPDTLTSLAQMGRYSRLVRKLIVVVDQSSRRAPWLTPRKLWWPVRERRLDQIYRAGSICFSIRKTVGCSSICAK